MGLARSAEDRVERCQRSGVGAPERHVVLEARRLARHFAAEIRKRVLGGPLRDRLDPPDRVGDLDDQEPREEPADEDDRPAIHSRTTRTSPGGRNVVEGADFARGETDLEAIDLRRAAEAEGN